MLFLVELTHFYNFVCPICSLYGMLERIVSLRVEVKCTLADACTLVLIVLMTTFWSYSSLIWSIERFNRNMPHLDRVID
jgi:hypothetical protein